MSGELPNWRERQKILWGEGADPDEQVRAGDAFFRVRRFNEALDFYDRADAQESIRNVMTAAVESGDWFIFKRARERLGEDLTEELKALAENAARAGKFLFALRAFEALSDRDRAAEMLVHLREVLPRSEILVDQLETEFGVKKEEEGAGNGAPESPGKG
ncbi:MAG: hypothetical protein ACYS47_19655 [Planctomycetota bacterium]|jgi:tetratricopeptide (TPR) repeat protein